MEECVFCGTMLGREVEFTILTVKCLPTVASPKLSDRGNGSTEYGLATTANRAAVSNGKM